MDRSTIFNIGLFQNTLRTATPVVLAGLGCLMTDHVGIMNIGVDGMMLVGAFLRRCWAVISARSWAMRAGACHCWRVFCWALFYGLFVVKFKE